MRAFVEKRCEWLRTTDGVVGHGFSLARLWRAWRDVGGGGGAAPQPRAPRPAPASAAPAAAPASAPSSAAGSPTPSPLSSSVPVLGDCEIFPANAIFNTRIDDVSRSPAHAKSNDWVTLAGRDVPFWTDWGVNENQADYGTYWGIPINVVDGPAATTDWPVVSYDLSAAGERGYADKSDCAVSDGNGGFSISRNCSAVPAGQRRFPFPLASKLLSQGG